MNRDPRSAKYAIYKNWHIRQTKLYKIGNWCKLKRFANIKLEVDEIDGMK